MRVKDVIKVTAGGVYNFLLTADEGYRKIIYIFKRLIQNFFKIYIRQVNDVRSCGNLDR